MVRLKALGKAVTTYRRTGNSIRDVLPSCRPREAHGGGRSRLDWGCARLSRMRAWFRMGIRCASPDRTAGAGTFLHRMPCCHDQANGRRVRPAAASCHQPTGVHGNGLGYCREEAVMGFEYGFSTTEPHCLTIWKAIRRFLQRGAGHHRSVHQFRRSQVGPPFGAHLFLPHGYEGHGPEHSSARLRTLSSAVRRIQHESACRRRRRRCSIYCADRCAGRPPFKRIRTDLHANTLLPRLEMGTSSSLRRIPQCHRRRRRHQAVGS